MEITLGGTKLDTAKIPVTSLEVELSAEGAAGGCTFTVEGLYDYENSKWKNDLAKTIKLGASLEVSGGYVQKKQLFYGYVDEYSLEHNGEGAPKITVTGIDGLGFLMNCREPYYGGAKKGKEIITEILKKSVSAGFAKSVEVDSGNTLQDFETPVIKEQVDDFKFLRILAERYGMVLMAINGELIFDSLWQSSDPLITLTVGKGLISFNKRISLKGQVGKVVMWGRDVNQKFIQGSASSVNTGGSGKSAAQLVTGLSKAILREYNEYARTEGELARLAQARLNSIAMGLVSGEGTCVGIPELIPGRFIKIEGMEDEANGSYFISKVTHSFTTEGYFTRFEIKGAKV
ncbi:MAG: phage late control D family protein [Christensenellales bacterium]